MSFYLDQAYLALAQCPVFDGLSDAQLHNLCRNADWHHLNAGEILSLKADHNTEAYVLIEGAIRIFFSASDHKREFTLAQKGPCELISALNNDGRQAITLQAETQSDLLCLLEHDLRQVAATSLLGLKLADYYASEYKDRTRQLRDLAFSKLKQRLATYLLNQARQQNVLELEPNAVIAAYLGTVPEVVSRHLASFKTEKLIDLKERTVTLLNRDSLIALANSDTL